MASEEIVNVWEDNLEAEFDKITELIEKYKYVSMDTEFPGIVIQRENLTGYPLIKSNVDELKLIQVGITLSDENGEMPTPTSTWQFNLKFDLNEDPHAKDSIDVLKEAGINFDELSARGIHDIRFADLLLSSGLVLNDDIHWITFHGAFDFAYLIKSLSNAKLPKTLDSFNTSLKSFFPSVYDLKLIVNEVSELKNGSLKKLGIDLDVKRHGIMHQAGSDAHLTALCFFKIKAVHFKNGIPRKAINKVYGLSSEFQPYNPTALPQNPTLASSIETRQQQMLTQAAQQQASYQNMYFAQQPLGFYAYAEVPGFNYYANPYDGQVFGNFAPPTPAAPLMTLQNPYKPANK